MWKLALYLATAAAASNHSFRTDSVYLEDAELALADGKHYCADNIWCDGSAVCCYNTACSNNYCCFSPTTAPFGTCCSYGGFCNIDSPTCTTGGCCGPDYQPIGEEYCFAPR